VVLGVYFTLLAQRKGVQHIHAHHGYFASWAAMIARRVADIPYSVTLHGSDLLIDQQFLDLKTIPAQFVVTVSEYNRRVLLEVVPALDQGHVFVNHPGIPIARQPFEPARPSGSSPALVLLSVGRLHPVKNHEFLISACRALKDQRLRFLCLIVGDGPLKRALRTLVTHLGLEEEVKVLGGVDPAMMPPCYKFADLFVLTSRSEGIPLVLMEAMQYGTVVVAPNITGLPELVRHGETGILYPEGDISRLVSEIQAIRNGAYRLGDIVVRARRLVEDKFNAERNTAVLADVMIRHVRRDGTLANRANA
jgi:glycosyltransferase involved in cell wall biosynthesis